MKRFRHAFAPAAFGVALQVLFPATSCDAQLRSTTRADALFIHAGEKTTLRFDTGSISPNASLIVRVYPYNDAGVLAQVPIATFRKPLGSAAQGRPVTIAVGIAQQGLYRAKASLSTPAGTALDETSVNLAVLSKEQVAGASDFGIVTHFGQTKDSSPFVLRLVKQAGFSWIRDELYWQEIEKAPGQFRFPASYDNYLAEAARQGLSPLIVLDYGNAVAYPKLFANASFPKTAETRALFTRYVTAVAKRYGKTVKHWEVWNEPDFSHIGYDNYLLLLKATYGAIKQVDPSATVISCGGGGIGGGPGADCIINLIKEGGLNYQDGFSIHPYMTPNTPEKGYAGKGGPIDAVSIPTTWPYLRDFVAQHVRDNGRPLQIWVTEFGWPVNPKVPGQDEANQAADLVRSHLLSRRYDAVRVLFWYDFIDDGTDPNNFEHNFGVLHHDLSPKPAFVAASVLARTLGEKPWKAALVDTDDVKVFRYGDRDSVIAGWTVGTADRTVSVNLAPGQYIQRDWQGIDTPVTITGKTFDWRVGPLPRYLLAQHASQ
jgi:hypothetical protein